MIAAHGCIGEQKKGYNLRNYAQLAMRRCKRIFGNTMKARELPQQKKKAWIGAYALSLMTILGMPMSVEVLDRASEGAIRAELYFLTTLIGCIPKTKQ
jgi:hypothetical protein